MIDVVEDRVTLSNFQLKGIRGERDSLKSSSVCQLHVFGKLHKEDLFFTMVSLEQTLLTWQDSEQLEEEIHLHYHHI